MDQHDLFADDDPLQGELNLIDPEAERSLLADLLESSRLYHTSKDYVELLDFVSRLRNFAPFNAMLLQVQKPGLTYAASAWDRKTRVGRIGKVGTHRRLSCGHSTRGFNKSEAANVQH